MLIENFRCPVCETTGKWTNVDQYRIKPENMHICDVCGFVTYPTKYKTEDEIKEYYRNDYRTIPRSDAIHTGTRKLSYHHYFLNPIFEEWRKLGLNKPIIGEIGSAIGMFIDWARGHFPEAKFHGTELTRGFKKVAKKYFDVDLHEDFDYSIKYDLITSYHVLEHQIDPDIKLKQYAECLKPHGFFYLACPIWFRDMNISAISSFDLEYYWHPDHINAWHEKHLEHIIGKAGLEIVHKDTCVYGNTYILKRATKPYEGKAPELNKECIDFMDRALKVYKFLLDHKTSEALATYKNCAQAWVQNYEFNRVHYDKNLDGLKLYLEEAIKHCPNSFDTLSFAADVMARYEKYDEAIAYSEKALQKRPNSSTVLMAMSNYYRQKALREKDASKKNDLFKQSANIMKFLTETAPDIKDKALSWLFFDYANMD